MGFCFLVYVPSGEKERVEYLKYWEDFGRVLGMNMEYEYGLRGQANRR